MTSSAPDEEELYLPHPGRLPDDSMEPGALGGGLPIRPSQVAEFILFFGCGKPILLYDLVFEDPRSA